jgi:CBS domain-containing protein
MTTGEVCNREVVIARPDDTIVDAAKRMREFHVGDLVVVDDRRRPIGILTDRDITVGVVAQCPAQLESLQVSDAMTRAPVPAEESESLESALKRMRSFGIRRLPIVNASGGLEGILTFDDVLELASEEMTDLAQLVGRERQQERERRPDGPA